MAHRQVLALSPNTTADQWNTLAWEYVKAGKGKDGLDLARKAADLSGRRNYHVLDTLAHAEYEAEHWPEAVLAWEQLLAINPKYFATASDPLCQQDAAKLAEARRRAALR